MATNKKALPSSGLEGRVKTLEVRVDALEAGRPGRKAKPMLAVRQSGVCALDPDRDSATCPDASIFRYQIGCHGTACRAKQHEAYERRKPARAKKVAPKKATAKKAAAPAKKVAALPAKKSAVKKAAPSGNGSAKKKAAAKKVPA